MTADTPPIVVGDLTQLMGGVWAFTVTTPDHKTHRVVVPESITSVHGVQLTAAVVAELYSQGLLPRKVTLPNAG